MEYARVKVLSLRRKLCSLQKDILELAHQYQTADYRDPRIRRKHMEAIVVEFVLEGWMEKYKEESQMFWRGDNLNRLE
tara:strand:+ start:416 stop:649 length:234 start_codon:yes stop_codon:yes gene_type:complete